MISDQELSAATAPGNIGAITRVLLSIRKGGNQGDSVKASEGDYRFVKRSACQRRPKVVIVAALPQLPVDLRLLRCLFHACMRWRLDGNALEHCWSTPARRRRVHQVVEVLFRLCHHVRPDDLVTLPRRSTLSHPYVDIVKSPNRPRSHGAALVGV
uniref:Uncharacterized protein n=1 Tax=Oryza rufipogon TaxID=4529 RepID=A0A0E0R5P5_ORYRU